MLNLNLLPPEQKKARKVSSFNATLLTLSLALIITTVIVLVILFAGRQTISFSLKLTKNQIERLNQEIAADKDIEKAALLINDRLGEVSNLTNKAILMTQIMKEISSLTPPSDQITNLSLQLGQSPHLKITGTADSRRSAALLVEKLNQSSLFSDVELLSSNITTTPEQKEIIGFTLQGNLERLGSQTSKEKK